MFFVFVGSRLKAFLPILLRAETGNDQIFLIIQLSHPGSESCKISGDHMLRQLSDFIKKFSLEDNWYLTYQIVGIVYCGGKLTRTLIGF